MKTVSESYLLGIAEGRELLRQYGPWSRDDMQRMAENLHDLARQGFAPEMRDMFKGERDFWRNQLRKAAA